MKRVDIWELQRPIFSSTSGPVCLTRFVHWLLITLRARTTNWRKSNEAPLEERQNETVPCRANHIDYIGPLHPPNNRNFHCLLLIDGFSCFLMVHPVTNTGAQATISAVEKWIHSFEIPQSSVHDPGTAFINTDFINWTQIILGIEVGIILGNQTAHSPWTNGKIETQNQHLARYWWNFVRDAGNNWSSLPPKFVSLTIQVSIIQVEERPTKQYVVQTPKFHGL